MRRCRRPGCLKAARVSRNVFFETYRFSEDLDFTITDKAHLDRDFLIGRFSQIGQWIYDATGIEFPADTFRRVGYPPWQPDGKRTDYVSRAVSARW
jgi:hypothetical protein